MQKNTLNRGSSLELPYFLFNSDNSAYIIADAVITAVIYDANGCKPLLTLDVEKVGLNSCLLKAVSTKNLPLGLVILKITVKDGDKTTVQDSHYIEVKF